jgi:hypothetical protein
MASGLVNAFLDAKLKSVRTSTALYAIANDVDGARIGRAMGSRACDAIAGMLDTAPVLFCTETPRLAEMLYAAFTGIARRLIESPNPHQLEESSRAELIRMASAYLAASIRIPAR